MIQLLIVGGYLALTCICSVSAVRDSWVVNDPGTPWPVLAPVSDENGMASIIDQELTMVSGVTDGEMIDAFEHFFWGLGHGVVMEMGALDGGRDTNSVSKLFEKFSWKRILIEANPIHREALRKQREAFCVNAAICPSDSMVHYSSVQGRDNMTSGIIEFMTVPFIRQYHRGVFNAGGNPFMVSNVDWQSPSVRAMGITEVKCVKLETLLKSAGVNHVNLFILDVEGAELPILETLDFDAVTFDVLVIEKNQGSQIRHFFATDARVKDKFKFVADTGRNFWYMNTNFNVFTRPGVQPQCYRGSVKSGVAGRKKAFCTETSLPIP